MHNMQYAYTGHILCRYMENIMYILDKSTLYIIYEHLHNMHTLLYNVDIND